MKKWQEGEQGWVLYRYAHNAVPVKVTLRENPEDGYVSVDVPALFGSQTFPCRVHVERQLFETLEEAERVNDSEPDYEPTPK